jgi:hypothetical protein
MKRLTGAVFAALIMLLPNLVAAQQHVTVDFSTGQLWHQYGYGQSDVYQVVLPRPSAQATMRVNERAVIGHLTQAEYKPAWGPTPNMRRKDPSLPRIVRYGHPRHALGIYRLRIDWQKSGNHKFWQYVRIHGGAKMADLNQAKSSGCIRMLDPDIVQLVANIEAAQAAGETEVIVTFGHL